MTIASIDSHTKLYGVIGDPVRHSKSPVMMNRAFAETGVNGAYMAFHITPPMLGDFIGGVRAMGIAGVNVTIPHKQEVIPFLDEIDASAQAIGAVNTIVNRDGRLTGFNTDGIGYVRSLKEEATAELEGKTILLLGAGGAARGIVHALVREQPGRIVISNRTPDKARALAAAYEDKGELVPISQAELSHWCGEADIVINTTSIGMHPLVDALPMDPAWLRPDTVVSDLIYNPLKTSLLKEAEARGCRIHGGLGMFIYQGAYAFEYWTGKPAPAAAMRESVLAALAQS